MVDLLPRFDRNLASQNGAGDLGAYGATPDAFSSIALTFSAASASTAQPGAAPAAEATTIAPPGSTIAADAPAFSSNPAAQAQAQADASTLVVVRANPAPAPNEPRDEDATGPFAPGGFAAVWGSGGILPTAALAPVEPPSPAPTAASAPVAAADMAIVAANGAPEEALAAISDRIDPGLLPVIEAAQIEALTSAVTDSADRIVTQATEALAERVDAIDVAVNDIAASLVPDSTARVDAVVAGATQAVSDTVTAALDSVAPFSGEDPPAGIATLTSLLSAADIFQLRDEESADSVIAAALGPIGEADLLADLDPASALLGVSDSGGPLDPLDDILGLG